MLFRKRKERENMEKWRVNKERKKSNEKNMQKKDRKEK